MDPGSASALLAAVLAGIAGAGAAIRTYGKKMKDALMFWKKTEPAADGPTATSASSEAGAATATTTPADPADDKPAEQ
ncbi:MAG: hypothetical protein IPK93_04015 [Solirubrobacterales bacterium]|nr:hypothetical protein [Solirubrobacterales bacterium]